MLETKLIENIIKALQYEYKAYSQFLVIAEKKTDSLIHDDLAALAEITGQEKTMADQTLKLSQVREQLIKKICEELNREFKTFTIENLMEAVEEPYKKTLNDIQTKLKDIVSKLTVRNGINQKLIENAIKYVNFNMQLIASPQPSVPLYGKSGQEVSQNTKRSMLDIKY